MYDKYWIIFDDRIKSNIPDNIRINDILNREDYKKISKGKRIAIEHNDTESASVITTIIINSYARAKLNKTKLDFIQIDYEIYYYDTDSLVVDKRIEIYYCDTDR